MGQKKKMADEENWLFPSKTKTMKINKFHFDLILLRIDIRKLMVKEIIQNNNYRFLTSYTYPLWWRFWRNGYRMKWTRRPEVKNLNDAVCISHSANIYGKGMNPTILSPAMGK